MKKAWLCNLSSPVQIYTPDFILAPFLPVLVVHLLSAESVLEAGACSLAFWLGWGRERSGNRGSQLPRGPIPYYHYNAAVGSQKLPMFPTR
ncbi:hypothetical protein B0T21DRAFT_353980 [Apiosordaria backusii]|uniref:Uncharacterized protein n=1 Tax=Apiosordaria backusii TaxID=314023 RepID=A0AA40K613_9PEZI|nr:hypothetical protein B0T21DRAFT_353980 [Apiosordaria backusii]